MAYTSTSKQRWIYWAYPHWKSLIDMFSKLRINLSSEISNISGLKVHNNINMVKISLAHRTRHGARKSNLKTSNPSCRKIRVIGI
jgi:hypothetical protein